MNIIRANHYYYETETALKAEFKNDTSNSVILLGPGVLAQTHKFEEYKKKYKKVIIFNQGQLDNGLRKIIDKKYFAFIKLADEVWDYDEHNLEILRIIRPDAKLHILKPCKELDVGSKTKDIDVLFYGSLAIERRTKILDELKSKNVNVFIANGKWGNELDDYIARAKICLNIHFFAETKLQEQARMIKWVSSNATIVSEISRKNYLGVHEVPYNELVNECLRILGK